MTEKNRTFWKFTALYLISILLVIIAAFRSIAMPPKMKATRSVSIENQLLNQEKLLFKVQKINEYFNELNRLETSLEAAENNAREIGRIKTNIDKTTLKLTSEIEKYRNGSDKELYVEIFKNFEHLLNLRKINEGLKKENLNAIEELHEYRQTYDSMLTLK